jgi:hypothetical protein
MATVGGWVGCDVAAEGLLDVYFDGILLPFGLDYDGGFLVARSCDVALREFRGLATSELRNPGWGCMVFDGVGRFQRNF